MNMLPFHTDIHYLDLGRELLDSDESEKTKIINKVCEYKKLVILMIDYNELNNFPSNLCSLIRLESLSISNNKIKVLPENIGQLKQLKHLYLRNNELEYLPETICNLTNLETLDLSCNKIEFLPNDLNKLIKLKNISVTDNRLMNIPKNISNNKFWCFKLSSYQINNLSVDCDFLIIDDLNEPLVNLPSGLKELRLFRPMENLNVKLPHGCKLFIDDNLQ
jgi:Leucine-rich repeat (LRR) protein